MTEILLIMNVMLALVIEANMILYFTKRMESIKKSLLPGGTEQQTEKKEKHIEQVKYTTCRKEKQ